MSHLTEPPAVSGSPYIDCNPNDTDQILNLFWPSILCSGVSSSTSIIKAFSVFDVKLQM